jgi:hypothetical protein
MPAKKKGMSLDEKKEALRNAMMTDGSFYSLKELESSIAKKSGLSPMIIKDILSHLLPDRVVTTEKVGTVNL